MSDGADEERWVSLFETIAVHWEDDEGRTLAYDTWTIGPLRFLAGTSVPLRVDRTGKDQEPFNYFSVSLLLSGSSTVTADDRTCTFEPGDLLVIDEGCPYIVEAGATSFISVLVERDRVLSAHDLPNDFSTNARKVQSLIATTLAAFLRTMIYNRQPTQRFEEEQIGRVAVELLRGVRMAMRRELDTDHVPNPIRESVQAFVRSNLTLRSLSPETVAAALTISRSSLYRAFAATGGVSHLIQTARLDAIRDLLLMPGETRSISDLAELFHFSGTAHFSRVFKARYGMSPTRLRSEGRSGASLAKPDGSAPDRQGS